MDIEPISLTQKAIAIDQQDHDICRIERYENIVKQTIDYALKQFDIGMNKFIHEKGKSRYPAEDRVILHSYLSGVAPFMGLTKQLVQKWREYISLLNSYENLCLDSLEVRLPFNDNFKSTPKDVDEMDRYFLQAAEIRANHSSRQKNKKRKDFEFYSEKYNGAFVADREGRLFDIKGKIDFLKKSSQFDSDKKIEECIQKIIGDSLFEFRRNYTPKKHILAYALITELAPVAQVDSIGFLEDYQKAMRKHMDESQFVQNFKLE